MHATQQQLVLDDDDDNEILTANIKISTGVAITSKNATYIRLIESVSITNLRLNTSYRILSIVIDLL